MFDDSTILGELARVWGYDSMRPQQAAAIGAGLERKDSLVVMPTGGGKSLCFQLPPLLTKKLSVVVSPLIALMKDQVDGLTVLGYEGGACLNSTSSVDEYNYVMRSMAEGSLRLLYVSPEKLLTPGMLAKLASCNGGQGPWAFAIDEAHCISQWGHDFRREYRRLSELRTIYPGAAVNAFTATATPRVREDIARQLMLGRVGGKAFTQLVGVFDRPNLTYRIVPKQDYFAQVASIVARHPEGATIVYAISRRATEEIAADLQSRGVGAMAYHAGLDARQRRNVQEDFAQERVNVVVATVAFGMGIDRGNVRCVIHAELPKSIENYQQETGRAGRDGLPSECVLLYSGGDAAKWRSLIESSLNDGTGTAESVRRGCAFIDEVQRFATGSACRHAFLSEYFGQQYKPPADAGCGACDICLGELDTLPDSTVVAQKILSCVARLAKQTPDIEFGAMHIVDVLRGARKAPLIARGHDKLSTFGLLASLPRAVVANCVNQLIDAGHLLRSPGQYPTISLTSTGWDVMRGASSVNFAVAKEIAVVEEVSYDAACFEMLRAVRKRIATERSIAAYLVFSDQALQEMSRLRPTTLEAFSRVKGVGGRKLTDFGETFCAAIAAHAAEQHLEVNIINTSGPGRVAAPGARARAVTPLVSGGGAQATPGGAGLSPRGRRLRAFQMFDDRRNLADVAEMAKVTVGTAANYLAEYIALSRPESIDSWIDGSAQQRIASAIEEVGDTGQLKPIFDRLEMGFTYDQIRLVVAHRRAMTNISGGEGSVKEGAGHAGEET